MKIKFKTDDGFISIDIDSIEMFCPIELLKTEITHSANGVTTSTIVNHDLETVCQIFLAPYGTTPLSL
jgi:hypothetical protein